MVHKKINRRKHTAKFTFKATAAAAAGFQCALVRAPSHTPKHKKHKKKKVKPHYSSCRSPKVYKHLKHGKYTFYVRAFNAAGTGTPAHVKFQM